MCKQICLEFILRKAFKSIYMVRRNLGIGLPAKDSQMCLRGGKILWQKK